MSFSAIDDHLSHFWSIYLPISGERDLVTAAPWAHSHAMQTSVIGEPSLRTALSACALMCLGRLQPNDKLIAQGRQLYAEALRETNRALQDNSKALTNSTLACCRALSHFEFFRDSDEDAPSSQAGDWSRHIGGLCSIYEQRDSSKADDDTDRENYEGIRYSAVIVDVTYRRSSFCARAFWRIRTRRAEQKTLRESLVDAAADIPSVLSQTDLLLQQLQDVPGTSIEAARLCSDYMTIVDDYHAIASSLHQWETRALEACRGVTSANVNAENTLKAQCRLHGYGFLHLCHFYWATSATLYASAAFLYQRTVMKLFELGVDQPPLPSLPTWMEAAPLVGNISSTAWHFFESEAGAWGPQSAAFSVGAAMHYHALTGQQRVTDDEGHLTDFGTILQLLERNAVSRLTGNFLRSIAVDAAPEADQDTSGDTERQPRIARRWFGPS